MANDNASDLIFIASLDGTGCLRWQEICACSGSHDRTWPNASWRALRVRRLPRKDSAPKRSVCSEYAAGRATKRARRHTREARNCAAFELLRRSDGDPIFDRVLSSAELVSGHPVVLLSCGA